MNEAQKVKCPAGYRIGYDIDDLPECKDCESYQACLLICATDYQTHANPSELLRAESQREQLLERLSGDREYRPIYVTIDSLIEDTLHDWLQGETDETTVFRTRANLIKRVRRHIDSTYAKELAYRRPTHFPLKWMEDDRKINQTLKRLPIINDVLEFFYNRQRSLRPALMEALKDQNETWIAGKPFAHDKGKKYPYATFITDSDFYESMKRSILTKRREPPSEQYMHRLIMACKRAGIILQLAGSHRTGVIYADGYYKLYGDKWTKVLFLRHSPEFIKGLQEFEP